MIQYTKSYAKKFFALVLMLAVSGVFGVIMQGDAAVIANRSILVSDSRPSETGVTYTFTGDHSGTSVQCIKIELCDSATGACTTPTGLTSTSATKNGAGFSGWTSGSWTLDNTANGTLEYTNGGGEAGGAGYAVSTSGIDNPSGAGTYFARVNTFTNSNCTDGATDDGVAAFAIVSGVTVSASVAETLTFTITDPTLGFGELGTGAVRYATEDELGTTTEGDGGTVVTVTTNAGGGVDVTIRGTGNTTNAGLYDSGITHLISAVAPSAVAAGTEGVATYGKNVGETGGATLTLAAGFAAGGGTALTTSPQTFVSANGAIDAGVVDLSLKAGISGITPAGTYEETLILVATPTF